MLKANIIEVLPERRTDTFDEVSGRWVSEKIYVAEKKKKIKELGFNFTFIESNKENDTKCQCQK